MTIQWVAKFSLCPQMITTRARVVARVSQRMPITGKKIMTASLALIPGCLNGERGNDQKNSRAVVASEVNQQPQNKVCFITISINV
ncbi:hypothetical protein CI593_16500 [Fischerella thermalis CCMEE 5194]|nr:hypothetical protein CI593_16500 [Fischerella thermalis CCMEE 5194]